MSRARRDGARPSAGVTGVVAAAVLCFVLLFATPGPTAAQVGDRLYVPNQPDATVSVIDTESRSVVQTIDLQELGFPPDAKPHDVVAAPDGSAWYVSLIGANTVVKFNADNEVVGRASFEVPGMMALPGDGGTLYVGRSMSAVNPPQSVGRIRTSEMTAEGVTAERVEVLFPRPHAIATDGEGRYLHTASLSVNRIAALEAGSETPEIITVDGPTHTFVQFAVSPDGRRLVATGQTSGRLLVFDRTQPKRLPLLASIEVGTEPWHPVFTPDGRYVVFGNKQDDTVTVVDTEDWTVAAVVEDGALSQPHGAVAGTDGRYVYVSSNNLDGAWKPEGWSSPERGGEASPPGNVAVIDLETRSVVDVIPVGHDPNGIGLLPGS
ncbi:MAG: YncE family protein [Candidatus Palauibacterales bacterium]|nr:YncE family protein [Candidatus Palauibacterales bacterium]